MNASSLTEMKGAIRSHVADKLKALPELFIHQASNAIFENLKSLPSFTNSNGVSIYLNMQAEVLTGTVLEYSLQQNKAVFIPKVIGKNSPDMVMYELSNGLQEIEKFPRNRWGIPEPSVESAKSRPDGTYSGKIDCVIMPGVAFDKNRGRVGHGKGYYGKYKLNEFTYVQHSIFPAIHRLLLREIRKASRISWSTSTNKNCSRLG